MTRPALEYENRGGARDSAWSVVGFALALVVAMFCVGTWWSLWRSLRSGATSVSFGVTPVFYLLPALVAAVCLLGVARGRKRFGLIGLALAIASVAAMGVLVRRSPWNIPRPRSVPTSAPSAGSAVKPY